METANTFWILYHQWRSLVWGKKDRWVYVKAIGSMGGCGFINAPSSPPKSESLGQISTLHVHRYLSCKEVIATPLTNIYSPLNFSKHIGNYSFHIFVHSIKNYFKIYFVPMGLTHSRFWSVPLFFCYYRFNQ